MTLRESLLDARRSSIVVGALERWRQNSVVADRLTSPSSPVVALAAWTHSSTALAVVEVGRGAISGAFDRILRGRTLRTVVAVIRSSFTYRWLTADPESAVIVVDLRETIVLGSLLPIVDALVETFLAWRTGSSLYEAGARTTESVIDTPVRALSIVVLSALLANLSITIASGSSSATGVLVTLGLVLMATLGLRVDTALSELRETRVGRLLIGLLEPPLPADPGGQSTGELQDEYSEPPSRGGERS